MPAQWTGEILAKMHIHGIKALQLAEQVGWNPKYLSAVMNGRRTPKNAEQKLTAALDELIGK